MKKDDILLHGHTHVPAKKIFDDHIYLNPGSVSIPKENSERGYLLIEDGVLNSLDIVSLITEINDRFDVQIPAEEIMPENFDSAEALWALITRLDED